MAIIFTDNSKSSQIYTALIKKYIYPNAIVAHLTKDAKDFYEHTVHGTTPRNLGMCNQKYVIILAEDYTDPKIADAILLLSKNNFKSQLKWYRKFVDLETSTPTTFTELGKLVVGWKGPVKSLSKLIPFEGRHLIQDFLAVHYNLDNGSYWKELNYDKVVELLSERSFRQHLTKLHLEVK